MNSSPSKPKTVGLQQVLEAADRADQQVSAWPLWKQQLTREEFDEALRELRDKPGLYEWLPDEDGSTYFGLDRDRPTRFDRPVPPARLYERLNRLRWRLRDKALRIPGPLGRLVKRLLVSRMPTFEEYLQEAYGHADRGFLLKTTSYSKPNKDTET